MQGSSGGVGGVSGRHGSSGGTGGGTGVQGSSGSVGGFGGVGIVLHGRFELDFPGFVYDEENILERKLFKKEDKEPKDCGVWDP